MTNELAKDMMQKNTLIFRRRVFVILIISGAFVVLRWLLVQRVTDLGQKLLLL